jgi:antitoxin (DNA-binding transcriptional repressor) of toxin-antitoxin stability system
VLNTDPASLSFAGTVVGSSATAQTVTVTNSGTASASISAVAATGDFSQTNNCSTLAVGASCSVSVGFKPTAGGSRTGNLTVTSNANSSPTTVSLSGSGIDSGTDIAAGRPTTASSSSSPYVPSNLTDPDASTYWESVNGSFPQWAQVDLGQNFSIGKVVLKLPPATAWSARTQTLSVQGSTDGSNFSTIKASAGYTFDPNANNNTATITFNAATARYVRVNITANTGWNAAQLSALQVFPSGGGSSPATLSANPTSLSFPSQVLNTASSARTVTVTNSGTAAATVSGITVTGDFSQTNTCGTSIAAGASCTVDVTFRPTASGTRTGDLSIAGNASNGTTTVALTGTGAGAANQNLAAGKPATESSHTDVYASSNVTDGNQGSYWESANNAFPQWVQVDLGSAQSAGRVVLQLPAGWGARNQTLSLSGSTDGAAFTTIKSSATYTFDPATNNTVTITFTATTQRYVRVNITANNGWPAGQISEFQVWNT